MRVKEREIEEYEVKDEASDDFPEEVDAAGDKIEEEVPVETVEERPADFRNDALYIYLQEMDAVDLFTPEKEVEKAREVFEAKAEVIDVLDTLAFVRDSADVTEAKLHAVVGKLEKYQRELRRKAGRSVTRDLGIPPREIAPTLKRLKIAHRRLVLKRNEFVEANLRLVVKIANRYRNRLLPPP